MLAGFSTGYRAVNGIINNTKSKRATPAGTGRSATPSSIASMPVSESPATRTRSWTYAIGFDPILRPRDTPSWLTETIPDDMLDRMRLRESLLGEAGGPLKRFALKRLIGDRDARGIIRLLRERYQPKDVLVQQQKVARAEALAFVTPVHFLSFPAMLKGWLDRVWTPGFAYDLTPEAWRGDINGRQPKLTHKKALIIQTTIFDKRAYDAGLREAMRMVIDEFTLTYPGIKNVEREYFYAVHGADDATRRRYLDRAYDLGRQF